MSEHNLDTGIGLNAPGGKIAILEILYLWNMLDQMSDAELERWGARVADLFMSFWHPICRMLCSIYDGNALFLECATRGLFLSVS